MDVNVKPITFINETNNFTKLIDLETVLLPVAVKKLSPDFLVPNLEVYIKELLILFQISEYKDKIVCKSDYSFTYSNGRTYFVVIIDFPFEFTKEYCGCLKHGYICFTNDDSTLYYFGEVLTESLDEKLSLKMRYYSFSKNTIISYDVMKKTVNYDKVMANQVVCFVCDIKHNCVPGAWCNNI